MTKKRKSEASALNEVDRTIYSGFRGAATALSQLYSQSVNQRKLAFQAGERHALEKLHEWMMMKEQEDAGLSEADAYAYVQGHLHRIEPVTECGSQIEQNEKKSASPVHREYSEDHQKEASNLVCPPGSDMDIS